MRRLLTAFEGLYLHQETSRDKVYLELDNFLNQQSGARDCACFRFVYTPFLTPRDGNR